MSSKDGLIDKTVTQGDTLPVLEAALTGAGGGVLNLTGATVTFKVTPLYGTVRKINAVCTIVSALAGTISYQFLAVDVDTPGIYWFQFEVIFNDLSEVSCPNNFYMLLEVLAEL